MRMGMGIRMTTRTKTRTMRPLRERPNTCSLWHTARFFNMLMNFIYIAKKKSTGSISSHTAKQLFHKSTKLIFYTHTHAHMHARSYTCAYAQLLCCMIGVNYFKKKLKINAKKRMIGWFLHKKRKKNVLKSKSVYIFKKEPS